VDLGFQNNLPPCQRVSVYRIHDFYSPLHLCPCRDPRHVASCELDSVCFVRNISRKLGRTICAPQLTLNSSLEMGCTKGQLVQPDICVCKLLPNSCIIPQNQINSHVIKLSSFTPFCRILFSCHKTKLPLISQNCLALLLLAKFLYHTTKPNYLSCHKIV